MTATPPCNPASAPALRDFVQVSAEMTMFLAEELLPLMAGLWPASANQLDGNVRGVAMAWGLQLRGLTAEQITDAVLELAGDTKRQFAPRPAEVKEAVLARVRAGEPVAQTGQVISIRACEMIAEVRVLERGVTASSELVAAEMGALQAELRRRGVAITGRVN